MVSVIIGGATGIGRAVATSLLKQGSTVFLFDYDASGLNSFKKSAVDSAVDNKLVTFEGDVRSVDALQKFKNTVIEKSQKIDSLFILAGISFPTQFKDAASIQKIFEVNFLGIVNAVSVFYEMLTLQQQNVELVIAGSKQGITNPPGNPGYNASKAALKSYAEGLSYDLRNSDVKVRLLVPGWTFTKLTGDDGTKAKPAGAWTPEQVYEYYKTSVAKNSDIFYIICPDNEVNEQTDAIRMEWSAKDITEGRPALSRWRPEYQEAFNAFKDSKSKGL